MTAPDDSVEMGNLNSKASPVDDDTVLLKDTEAADELKQLSIANLREFFTGNIGSTSFLSAVDEDSFLPSTPIFFPISGVVSDGDIDASALTQISPTSTTYRNLTVTVTANSAGGDSAIFLQVNGMLESQLVIPAGQTGVFTSTDSTFVNAGDTVIYVVDVTGSSTVKISGIAITADITSPALPVSASSLTLQEPAVSTVAIPIAWDLRSFVGTGIEPTADDAIYKLTGNVFQLNASVAIQGTGSTLDAAWESSDTFGGSYSVIGVLSHIVAIDGSAPNSSAPISTVVIDARTADVFVKLVTDAGTSSPSIVELGTWAQIIAIGFNNGSLTEFTWAASDEVGTLGTGVKYVTEVATTDKAISTVKLTVRNAPTVSELIVDIEKETSPGSNTFASIFDTPPQIESGDFFNDNSVVVPAFNTSTWELNRRLRINVTTLDGGNSATGLKVTLL